MPSRLLNRIYHFLRGPNPLDPRVWKGRLSPLTFRRFDTGDLGRCLELYTLNEPNRFPEGVIKEYEKCLKEQQSYFLVAEREGRVIASGGLHYLWRRDFAALCFGLVHPDYQGKGIGTALVLARLALVDASQPVIHVLIFAVAGSIGFYRRLGFRPFTRWTDQRGQMHPSGHLRITAREIGGCRDLLTERGVSFPPHQDQVPLHEQARPTG